ncbi:hypothetical protein JXA88_15635 [Candidatus Fermentibacteria bacterium]|nr:hypothetical protein [Candidatus Fermentibacteria bacterium]
MLSLVRGENDRSHMARRGKARSPQLALWFLLCALFCTRLNAGPGKLDWFGFEPVEDPSPPPNPERFAEFAQITGLAALDSTLQEFALVSDRAPRLVNAAPSPARVWGDLPSAWQTVAARFVSPPPVRAFAVDESTDPVALIDLRVSPNNLIGATPNPEDVWVFDPKGNVMQRYEGPSPFEFEGDPHIVTDSRILPQDVFLVLVSDDGSTYAATTMKGSFAVMRDGRWELITPSYTKGWCPRGMAALSYHGTYLVTWGSGNVVTLGDPLCGAVLWSKPVVHDGELVVRCDFLFDEQSFVVLSEGSSGTFIRIVDISGATVKESALPKPPETSSLARLLISPDGRWLSASGDGGVDVYFLDLDPLTLVFQIDPGDLCHMIRARGGPCHAQ